jgi:diguanylate cyclase (GGDEF)-like protein
MWPKLRKKIEQSKAILITAPTIAVLVIFGELAGFFQLLELASLDLFFRLRPLESPDPRIAIVTIDESDISAIGHWPMSDGLLSQALKEIKSQKPKLIALDIYRNLPVEPGYRDLEKVFQSTPNLIGVEKAAGETVAPPPTLKKLDRVALSDLVLDTDSKIRRSLISIRDNGNTKLALGARLALEYLAAQGITLEKVEGKTQQLKLGKAIFVSFRGNDGGYVRADDGGYQILLNFRGRQDNFQTISITEVLNKKISPNLMRDRIVLIGSTAVSLNDLFYTPYSSKLTGYPQLMPGVVIHANITSQILSAALEGRPLIKTMPEWLQWLWIFLWSGVSAAVSYQLLRKNNFKNYFSSSVGVIVLNIVLVGGSLFLISYLAFLQGWWLIVASPALAAIASAIFIGNYYSRQLQHLAFVDGLTQVANRRYFDDYLSEKWWQSTQEKKYLSLILCDVDYFKVYNDTYGHQAGDKCLQLVAKAIGEAIRKTDLAARYGGEEFVVILPNTDRETALKIAQRISDRVRALQIPHSNSQAKPYVTLSCGLASIIPDLTKAPVELIEKADSALYAAKKEGRDRVSSN